MAIFGSFFGCVFKRPVVGPRNPQNRIPHEILGGYDSFLDSAHDFFFFDKLFHHLHVRGFFIFQSDVINDIFEDQLSSCRIRIGEKYPKRPKTAIFGPFLQISDTCREPIF